MTQAITFLVYLCVKKLTDEQGPEESRAEQLLNEWSG